jgi:hypothetical protein
MEQWRLVFMRKLRSLEEGKELNLKSESRPRLHRTFYLERTFIKKVSTVYFVSSASKRSRYVFKVFSEIFEVSRLHCAFSRSVLKQS